MTAPEHNPDHNPNHKPKHKAQLSGVSETALMTLYSRAREARRPDTILDDPMAIHLVDSIDYDFSRFGDTRQDMAVRAKTFDKQARAYLTEHPDATVVALAEGMQTSFWRLSAALPQARFQWLTIDLPAVIDIRRRLLPESPRVQLLAQSALDYSWMDRVNADGAARDVLITAEGLLMYLQPEEARGLIAECAKRFPGGRMLFDSPPPWFAGLAQRGWLRPSMKYKVPPMPFHLTAGQAAELSELPGVSAVHDIPMEPARGWAFNAAISLFNNVRLLDPVRPITTLLEFG